MQSKGILVREARYEDADAIAVLLTQLGYPQGEDFVIGKLVEFSARESAKVFVAELDAKVVGFLSFDCEPLFHREGNIGSIMAMCVLEEHRGEGIGKRLIASAEEEAKLQGCVRIAVASGMQRLDTHKFYLSQGYEEKTKRFVKDFE